MKTFVYQCYAIYLTSHVQRLILLAAFLLVSSGAYADGSDIFLNTDKDLVATLTGSGKRYIYLAEGLLSLASYIRTKNLMVLFGIVIVSFFFNVVLTVSGVQS